MKKIHSGFLMGVCVSILTNCAHINNEKDLQPVETASANTGPEGFLSRYEAASASQDWNRVAPLVHDDVSVTFSDGSVYIGIKEVQKAFERNFSMIKGDTYSMSDVHWIKRDGDIVVYKFAFQWSGYINGQLASGQGRGTGVLIDHDGTWKLLVEHLAPKG
jgi:ketosteroid isomerase-like protein